MVVNLTTGVESDVSNFTDISIVDEGGSIWRITANFYSQDACGDSLTISSYDGFSTSFQGVIGDGFDLYSVQLYNGPY